MVKKTTSMRTKAVFEGKGLVTTWRSCGSSAAIVMSQVWRTRIAINIPSSPCVFLIVWRVVIVAVASIWLNNWIIWQKFHLCKENLFKCTTIQITAVPSITALKFSQLTTWRAPFSLKGLKFRLRSFPFPPIVQLRSTEWMAYRGKVRKQILFQP